MSGYESEESNAQQTYGGDNSDNLHKIETSSVDQTPQSFTGDLEKNHPKELINEAELMRQELNVQAARELSRRLTGADEILAKANDTDKPLPAMGGGKPLPPPIGDRDAYSVVFDGPTDTLHPHNWPLSKKIQICYVVAISAFSVSLGSAIFAETGSVLQEKFHVGSTVTALGTSLYVLGFASGPVIWGPLSEIYGRRMVLLCSLFGFTCFSFAVASGENIQSIMICRFFQGFIGAAPMVVAPAALADLFGAGTRGKAMSIFAMVLFGGPMLAPIFGGFIVKNRLLGWRWTSYFTGIAGVIALASLIFLFEETHHPIILVHKAETLRRRTGNWGIHAPHDELSLSLKEIVEKNISRPIVMLLSEPILFLITLYNSFIYGLLYLMLTAVPLVFEGNYKWSPGVAQLPYLSMFIGCALGGVICIYFERSFNAKMIANGGRPIPEERLPPMMVGSVFFAVGLFWFGWTGDFPEKIHWIVPTISLSFIGIGLISIFLPCINYIIDCYLMYAASALAGNAFMRSSFAAAFPLFSLQMFKALQIKYGGTLLGAVAVAMMPVPFLFYKYGARVRKLSKYSPDI